MASKVPRLGFSENVLPLTQLRLKRDQTVPVNNRNVVKGKDIARVLELGRQGKILGGRRWGITTTR
jgi:hypothetical protein